MMDGTFVKELAGRLAPGATVLSVNGINRLVLRDAQGAYDLANIEHPEPMADPLEVTSLRSVMDMLREGVEALDYEVAFVHIESPTVVKLCSPASRDSFARRQVHVMAQAITPKVSLGAYVPVEQLLIELKACFSPGDDRDEVVACLGTIKDEKVRQSTDDGLTQTVTSRAGVALVADRQVPLMPRLSPRRTFAEVYQPSSLFVLRLRSGGDNAPVAAALIEADGGAWRLDAMAALRSYFEAQMALLDEDRRVSIIA